MKSVLIRVNPWLKNEKGCLFSEKTTKIAPAFIQNNANFKNIKIGVSSFETTKYEILTAWRGEKANPIKPNFILDVSSLGFLSGDKSNLSKGQNRCKMRKY